MVYIIINKINIFNIIIILKCIQWPDKTLISTSIDLYNHESSVIKTKKLKDSSIPPNSKTLKIKTLI